MDKNIAQALWQVANARRHKAFTEWTSPGRVPEKQREAARQRCGAWAEAANELYAMCHPTEKTGTTRL